jgi:hypothetical protein
VNDNREVCLAKEGSVYVKSTCDVPPHLFHFDDNTSHLKNTVTGKCICRLGDKLVEIDHVGVNNSLFEWTIVDGVVRSYMNKYVEGDLTFVDETYTQWHIAESFDEVPAEVEELITETVAEALAPAPVEEVSAPVEEAPVVEEVSAPVEEAPAQVVEEAPVVEEVSAPVEEAPAQVVEEEDVPVNRGAALIEEALNAQASAPAVEEVEEEEGASE